MTEAQPQSSAQTPGAGIVRAILSRASTPTAPALVGPGCGVTTYGDLDTQTARIASALKRCGVRPGDRVAVVVQKSTDAFMLALGILRAGAILVPLNTAYTSADVARFPSDAEPSLVVSDPKHAEAATAASDGARRRVETLDASGGGSWAGLVHDALPLESDPDLHGQSPAVLLYTSGTTGPAKGALLTHGNLAHQARALMLAWSIRPSDVVLHALPLFHAHGLLIATLPALWAGASLMFRYGFDADDAISCLPSATCFMGVPFYYARLAANRRLSASVTSAIRLFVSGSAPLPAVVRDRILAQTGHVIADRYGMTETLIIAANRPDGHLRVGSVGVAVEDVEIRITDIAGHAPVPVGTTGMVEVRGPNVCSGYWRNPDATRSAFRSDGFFVTGDVGHLDADGFLWLTGRAKDIIIYCGLNIHPGEVEAHLAELYGVSESAVFGVPHPEFGEAVVAAVVPEPGSRLVPHVVRGELVGRLADYKVPKRVAVIEALPRNAMGKVDKGVLRERYARLFTPGPDRAPPAGPGDSR